MSASAIPSSEQLRPDEQPLAQYAAISRPAVAGLALGLASPLVLVSPLLVVVPLAGIAVAAFALRQISTSAGQLKGQWPATIGLCLAAMFLGWGTTRQVSRQVTLADQAQQFTDSWLALVKAGRLHEADQLRRSVGERLNDPDELARFYQENLEANESMRSFFAGETMQEFQALGTGVRYRFVSIFSQANNGIGDEVVLVYEFSGADGESPRKMWISVIRPEGRPARTATWLVRQANAVLPSQEL